MNIQIKREELLDIVLDISSYEFHYLNNQLPPVISKLQSLGIKLGVISNSRLFTPIIFLKKHGLIDYFEVMILSRDIGYIKPHPKIFKEALNRANVTAGASIYVGDVMEIDIFGAKLVGIKAILYGKREPIYSSVGVDLKKDSIVKYFA